MVAKLLCYYLCLFDRFVGLHAMDEKSFIDIQRAARGQRPSLVGEEVRKEDIGKVES
jgi:hypothetical protein